MASAHNVLQVLQQANFETIDPGASAALAMDRNFQHIPLVSATSETRTLAAPTKAGQFLLLSHKTDGGDIVVTVATAYDEVGSTTLTFSDAGQFVLLGSVASGSAYVWRVVAHDGVAGPAQAADVALGDEVDLTFGAPDLTARWDTSDANANKFLVQVPAGTATNVPVIVIGQSIVDVDMGIHNGVVDPLLSIVGVGAVATGPVVEFRKARGTAAAPTVVTSGDDVGSIRGYAAVAAGEWVQTAEIRMDCAGTVATTRGPGTLTFQTATDAAPSVLTTALTIGADQKCTFAAGIAVTGGIRAVNTTAVAITGATVLTLADSNSIFTVSQEAAYDIDLPSPTTGAGSRFIFQLVGPASNNVTITVLGGAATFEGTIVNDVTSVLPCTGATITFASGVAALGDNVEIISTATGKYFVRAVSSANGGITIT